MSSPILDRETEGQEQGSKNENVWHILKHKMEENSTAALRSLFPKAPSVAERKGDVTGW